MSDNSHEKAWGGILLVVFAVVACVVIVAVLR